MSEPAQVLPDINYVGFTDKVCADGLADMRVSHLFSSLSFIFPALKSPAAFHEQRKSLERSKVRGRCHTVNINPSTTAETRKQSDSLSKAMQEI